MSDAVADLTIEAFAHSELALRERVIELEANVRSYRELAQAAIGALYGQTIAGERERERYERLLVEYRALRLRVLHPTEAA